MPASLIFGWISHGDARSHAEEKVQEQATVYRMLCCPAQLCWNTCAWAIGTHVT
jgi:hypothetical protein